MTVFNCLNLLIFKNSVSFQGTMRTLLNALGTNQAKLKLYVATCSFSIVKRLGAIIFNTAQIPSWEITIYLVKLKPVNFKPKLVSISNGRNIQCMKPAKQTESPQFTGCKIIELDSNEEYWPF